MKLNLLETIKKHKRPIMIIASTVLEIGAIVLALKEGAKIKEELEKLPEDVTAKDRVVAVGKHIAGPVVLGVTGEFLKYRLFKDDTKNLAELAILATTLGTRAANYEESVKEVVSEEQVEEIAKRAAVKNMSQEDGPLCDVYDTKTGDKIFVWDLNERPIKASHEWIEKKLAQAVSDAKDDNGELSLQTLAEYWCMDGEIFAHDLFGFTQETGFPRKIYYKYPDTSPIYDRRFDGKPYIIMRLDTEPVMIGSHGWC